MKGAQPLADEHFRDELSNVDKEGKRLWIFAKKPNGRFYNYRTWLSWFFMIMLFAGPFMKWNGRPLLLLNVLERKFIILGMVFWPQDLNLFALLMLSFIIFIVLFTVLFGRVWCGWACPQTIFMEMLFRKIEYLIDGDYQQQKRLADQDWNSEKIMKRTFKHVLFFVLSFAIANTFLGYIIGIDELKLTITDGPFAHPGKLASMLIFTGVFYGVFAHLRELVCVFICPYGRLQGLMLDKNSMVVAYDYVRGEPRGKLKKTEEAPKGDCIDCKLCVSVCPTGIDIRNGTQLECINCTACIDACDEVMVKIEKPKGLVRFASVNNIKEGKKLGLNLRNGAYGVVLAALFGVFLYLLITRKLVETTLLRTPGMLYQTQEEGKISNLYSIEFVNKTFEELPIELKLIEPKGEIKFVDGKNIVVDKESVGKSSFFLILDAASIKKISTPVEIEVWSNGKLIEEMKSKFNGPVFNPNKPKEEDSAEQNEDSKEKKHED
ncbi:MAG: cytochrome c oxidase accessory protein CcoG [Bacteroidetes bacterium B1(2017)]|nr:MAG: cytochrome c oxidase accessory protein CcoG [Bacteroidetes bacterium B1(2017)]